MSISDKDRRNFYEKECEKSGWSVRELKRQISTSLFERLLLSDGDANKEKVYELATQGQELSTPEDIIKDPYVFEFLGVPENKPMLESELEKALVRQIEDFMLELGRGFITHSPAFCVSFPSFPQPPAAAAPVNSRKMMISVKYMSRFVCTKSRPV